MVFPHWEPPEAEAKLAPLLASNADFTDSLRRWKPTTGWEVVGYAP